MSQFFSKRAPEAHQVGGAYISPPRADYCQGCGDALSALTDLIIGPEDTAPTQTTWQIDLIIQPAN